MINNPAVKIEIRTVAEASQRQSATGPVIVEEAEETADTIAADKELRAYFEKRNPNDQRMKRSVITLRKRSIAPIARCFTQAN